jgi:hypothetical protein
VEDLPVPPPTDTSDANRLIVFSDAVVAIAITLLALDLPVPHAHTPSELWTSARHDARFFLAFFISFGVIAALWSVHHSVFRYVDRSDARLRLLTFGWLLVIVLIPFAARLLAASGGVRRHDAARTRDSFQRLCGPAAGLQRPVPGDGSPRGQRRVALEQRPTGSKDSRRPPDHRNAGRFCGLHTRAVSDPFGLGVVGDYSRVQ